MTAVDDVIRAAAVLLPVALAAAAWTEARLRASGWPVVRCGAAVPALLVHDVLAGWGCLAGLGGLGRWTVGRAGLSGPVAVAVEITACLLAAALSEAVLRRRRGVALRSVCRPRHRVAEPVLTLRLRLLGAVERAGVRRITRWIDVRLDRGLDRNGDGADQLLPALWPGVRLQLREAPGTPRTEVGLLLMQAQAVMEDAAPARDRMYALLHLVYERAGCGGVRAALHQASRSPVRHGRSGAAAWAIPSPTRPSPTRPSPTSP